MVGGRHHAEALPAGVTACLAQARACAKRVRFLLIEPPDWQSGIPDQALTCVHHAREALIRVQHVEVLAQQRGSAPCGLRRLSDARLRPYRDHPGIDEGADAAGRKAQHHPQRDRHLRGQRLHHAPSLVRVEAQQERGRKCDGKVSHDARGRVWRQVRESARGGVRCHGPQDCRRDGGRQCVENLAGHLGGCVFQHAGGVGGIRLQELGRDSAEHLSLPGPPAPTRSR